MIEWFLESIERDKAHGMKILVITEDRNKSFKAFVLGIASLGGLGGLDLILAV